MNNHKLIIDYDFLRRIIFSNKVNMLIRMWILIATYVCIFKCTVRDVVVLANFLSDFAVGTPIPRPHVTINAGLS